MKSVAILDVSSIDHQQGWSTGQAVGQHRPAGKVQPVYVDK